MFISEIQNENRIQQRVVNRQRQRGRVKYTKTAKGNKFHASPAEDPDVNLKSDCSFSCTKSIFFITLCLDGQMQANTLVANWTQYAVTSTFKKNSLRQSPEGQMSSPVALGTQVDAGVVKGKCPATMLCCCS